MVFFSKNRTTALKHVKKLQTTGYDKNYYKNKTVRLAKKQHAHLSGWKTWVIIDKK